ncbi:hypothetical protein ACFOD0_03765 [Shewanella intestini]
MLVHGEAKHDDMVAYFEQWLNDLMA